MYYLSRPRTTALFRQLEGAFTDDEVERTLTELKQFKVDDALVGANGGEKNSDVRRSKVAFIPPIQEMDWLFSKVSRLIKQVNAESFNFDISYIGNIQYTEYHGTNAGTYHDHLDLNTSQFMPRKLSISIQLSHDSEYEGGDLEIKTISDRPYRASRNLGAALIFPSFLLHGVTPVTSGVRKSLVAWINGPEFR